MHPPESAHADNYNMQHTLGGDTGPVIRAITIFLISRYPDISSVRALDSAATSASVADLVTGTAAEIATNDNIASTTEIVIFI